MKEVVLVDHLFSVQNVVGSSGGEVAPLAAVIGIDEAQSFLQSSEVADELSSGVLQLIHSVLVSRMDGPTVESVVERGCTLGSAEGGVVGLGVLGQVGGGQEPSAPELEPISLQNILTVTTLDGFSSDVPSLGGEVVALESKDYDSLVEPMRMLLPS